MKKNGDATTGAWSVEYRVNDSKRTKLEKEIKDCGDEQSRLILEHHQASIQEYRARAKRLEKILRCQQRLTKLRDALSSTKPTFSKAGTFK